MKTKQPNLSNFHDSEIVIEIDKVYPIIAYNVITVNDVPTI